MKLIVDSHLDLAWNAMLMNRDLSVELAELNQREAGIHDTPYRGNATTVLPEMRRGSVCCCLGTLVAGASSRGGATRFTFASVDIANSFACGQLNYYHQLENRNEVRILSTSRDLASHVANWEKANNNQRARLPVGIIVAFEGCDSITTPQEAESWFNHGVRCASLVHYGEGRYAGGTGTNEPLTPLGRELLAEFSRLGILLDVTHLSDQAFEDVLDFHAGPIFASHQNCRALVPRPRQFTDEQIVEVIDRGGVIGVACDNWMLSPHWPAQNVAGVRPDRSNVPVDTLADHIDHICQLAGNANHAAIGSDLDGGFGTEQAPWGIDSIADLQKLDTILQHRGYSDDEVALVLGRNWISFFQKYLPSS
jgi:membrane dipeptidase